MKQWYKNVEFRIVMYFLGYVAIISAIGIVWGETAMWVAFAGTLGFGIGFGCGWETGVTRGSKMQKKTDKWRIEQGLPLDDWPS